MEANLEWDDSNTLHGIDLDVGGKLHDCKSPLVFRGDLKKGAGIFTLCLFDKQLVVLQAKGDQPKASLSKVLNKPIPIQLLAVSDQVASENGLFNVANKIIVAGSCLLPSPGGSTDKDGFPVTVTHVGRNGFSVTFYAESVVEQKRWLDVVRTHQQAVVDRVAARADRDAVFTAVSLGNGVFAPQDVVCVVPYDGGRKLALAKHDGIHVLDRGQPEQTPVKVFALPNITQLDILDNVKLFIALLSDGTVITSPLSAFDTQSPSLDDSLREIVAKKASFFLSGICLGKTLIGIIKAGILSSTVKVFERNSTEGSSPDTKFKLMKEFHVPSEIYSAQFLKTKLCLGCDGGFEVVDLNDLDRRPILDLTDPLYAPVIRREAALPIVLYRIDDALWLACYNEFAFFVDNTGRRAKPECHIDWEGSPTAFVLRYPYILAFSPTFIEIWNISEEKSELRDIIPGTKIWPIFAETNAYWREYDARWQQEIIFSSGEQIMSLQHVQ